MSNLIESSRIGNVEQVKLLLLNGADVNFKGNDGYNSLMYASTDGHREIIEILLLNGADVNAINNYGSSSLMYSSKHGYFKIIEILLQSGANIYYNHKEQDAFKVAKNEEVHGLLLKYTTKGILKEVPYNDIIDDNIDYLS